MTVLAIESAGSVASVAILKDNRIVGEYSINTGTKHSETLLPMTDALIKSIGMEISDIDYIAVSVGPGSFTGLRIGISQAKAMAYAFNKLTVAVPTLKTLATVGVTPGIICSVMDARRAHVYCGLYEYNSVNSDTDTKAQACAKQYKLEKIEENTLISAEELVEKLNASGREVTFVGDGIAVLEKFLENATFTYKYALPTEIELSAAKVAYAAVDMIEAGELTTASALNAEYLRPSQAERTKEAKDNYIIREIQASDAAGAAEIEKIAIGDGAWSEETLKDVVSKDDASYLVACCGDTICGLVGAWISLDEAEITNVAVHPEYRRKGIARALLRELITRGRKNGVKRFVLEVRKSNKKAINLYESMNFEFVGERKDFYSRPKEDACIYELG